MEKYNLYNVLVGMFNHFPKDKTNYRFNDENFNLFFYKRRGNYSVLNNAAFDKDDTFPTSKELDEAYDTLDIGGLITRDVLHKGIDHINRKAFKIAFNKFSKPKFDDSELKELEKLSLEFQNEFC